MGVDGKQGPAVHRVDGVEVNYQCQLCGHNGPLSEPCPRCETIAESFGGSDFALAPLLTSTLHRLRATRAQLLDETTLRQLLVEKEAQILSLRHTIEVMREKNGVPSL